MISIAAVDNHCHQFSLDGFVTDIVLISTTREREGGRQVGREAG